MSILVWDKETERRYTLGVDHGVLYPMTNGSYTTGVVWNGLSSVKESPDGAEPQDFYGDNMLYGSIRSKEKFSGSIEAYMYPKAFAACDGTAELAPGIYGGQQGRQKFGLSYRTMAGDATMSDPTDFTIHLVYGATASPSEKEHNAINDSPDVDTLSWDFDTVPTPWSGHQPTSHVLINSWEVDAAVLKKIMDKLYGTESESGQPTMLLPDQITELLSTTTGGSTTGN